MKTVEIELIESSIANGRIYFPVHDWMFFPVTSFGDREESGHVGRHVVFHAAGEKISTDIRRLSGERFGPRSSFSSYLRSVRAKEGDRLRVTWLGGVEYRVEHVSS